MQVVHQIGRRLAGIVRGLRREQFHIRKLLQRVVEALHPRHARSELGRALQDHDGAGAFHRLEQHLRGGARDRTIVAADIGGHVAADETVVDVDDRNPGRGEFRHDRHQRLRVGRCEHHGVRLRAQRLLGERGLLGDVVRAGRDEIEDQHFLGARRGFRADADGTGHRIALALGENGNRLRVRGREAKGHQDRNRRGTGGSLARHRGPPGYDVLSRIVPNYSRSPSGGKQPPQPPAGQRGGRDPDQHDDRPPRWCCAASPPASSPARGIPPSVQPG